MNRTGPPFAGERPIVSYRASVLWSSLGNGFHLLAGVAFMPLLTRIYGLDAYGRFGVYYGLVAVLSLVACLRLDLAIPVQRGRLRCAALTLAGMALASVVCGLVGLGATFLWSLGLLSMIGLPVIWATAGSSCCAAWNRMLYYQGVGNHRFNLLATARIGQSIATVGAQVAAYQYGLADSGLIYGDVAGRIVALFFLHRSFGVRVDVLRGLTARQIYGVAWESRRLVVANGIWSLLQSAGIRLPVILVATWWGSEAAGTFAVCHRVLDAPRVILGAVLGHAWFAESTRLLRFRPAALSVSYRRQVVRLAALVLPMVPLCAFWGEELFSIVFGDRWRQAGTFASVLAGWFVVRAVAWPLRQSLLTIGAQRVLILSESLMLCGLLVIVGLSAWLGFAVVLALGIYGIWATGVQAVQVLWHWTLLKRMALGNGGRHA